MVSSSFVSSVELPDLSVWRKAEEKRALISFELELTARCNNACRHCYINLPAEDRTARQRELSFEEIDEIANEAVSLGAVWCLITGGEPLLRGDFLDIYLSLKRKGLLVSVFTNATLVRKEHIRLFKKYPPRDIEVTVYGVSKETYENVSRNPGSFAAFRRGLALLLGNGIKVRLKALTLRSNAHEYPQIMAFCRERTKDFSRFDPFLHLRYDRDPARNTEIVSERLSPTEIVALERSDPERWEALVRNCGKPILPESSSKTRNRLFHCGMGKGSFSLSYDGIFRLCSSLWHPDCIYDLRKGALTDAWRRFAPKVRSMRSDRPGFLEKCRICSVVDLCMWCPARAYLEIGELDGSVEFFCKLAHARARALGRDDRLSCPRRPGMAGPSRTQVSAADDAC